MELTLGNADLSKRLRNSFFFFCMRIKLQVNSLTVFSQQPGKDGIVLQSTFSGVKLLLKHEHRIGNHGVGLLQSCDSYNGYISYRDFGSYAYGVVTKDIGSSSTGAF